MTDRAASRPYLNIGGRVLGAIDASIYTVSVCHYAAWAALRLNAPLEYLHVLDRHLEAASVADFSGNLELGAREKLLKDLAAVDESRGKLGQERGRLLLQQAIGIASDLHAVVAETRMRHGSLVDTLSEVEADVRLFVMGKRGEHANFANGHLGSELERVVRAVHRPLLVASREFAEVSRVLIAFDGSTTSRKGVEIVAASPLFRGLDVHLVMVADPDEQASKHMTWALDGLLDAGFKPTSSILPGVVEQVIADYVREKEINLLVMGAYGHSRIRQLIVGSTTTTMLRTCHVPVLLLR
jgi:nucleotide-binding universal stress UspA family protein